MVTAAVTMAAVLIGGVAGWLVNRPLSRVLTWFFRGNPHVHIWIHVANDPQAPFSAYFG